MFAAYNDRGFSAFLMS